MANNNYNIVEVVWIDAEEHGEIGWNDIKAQLRYAKKPCPQMKTVGYEVYRDEDHISLLSSISVKDSSTVEKIPMAFIKTITTLVPRKPTI
ncbi:MAG: hypothetical protein H8D80_01595 [Proteobacteria bacterium]|nr:hypothetical protein [Pseudomonadota bacterium]